MIELNCQYVNDQEFFEATGRDHGDYDWGTNRLRNDLQPEVDGRSDELEVIDTLPRQWVRSKNPDYTGVAYAVLLGYTREGPRFHANRTKKHGKSVGLDGDFTVYSHQRVARQSIISARQSWKVAKLIFEDGEVVDYFIL